MYLEDLLQNNGISFEQLTFFAEIQISLCEKQEKVLKLA